jgi:glycosyltransferase involved in cell wall biosynthesis
MTLLHVLVNAINDNAVPRGPDRYLLELLPQMLAADDGLRITLAHAPWQVAMAGTDLGPRVRLLPCHPPRKPMPRLIWQAVQFPRIAKGVDADVTFLPNLIWTPGLRGPSVMTAHDLLHFRHPEKFGRLKAALLRQVIRRAIARADAVIAVSAFTAGDVVRFGRADAARVATITEGGPARVDRAGAAEKTFLFVGKLERSKGIADLVLAFRRSAVLAQAGFRLLIVGPDGNAAGDVAEAMRGADDRIARLGFVSDAALRDMYLTCRGFVFPSVAEGFGLVVLEAMAHGAPVIAADATSLPEVVGQAGVLVPPGDVEALQAALERLATDDALFLQLQAAGYARLGDFSWQRAGAATAALLRRVAQ